jgi:hypothetical protein
MGEIGDESRLGGWAAQEEPAVNRLAIAVPLLAVVMLAAWTALLGIFGDHIEGNVVISAWEYLQGTPLYQRVSGAPQFAHYYGPLAYLVQVPVLFAGGGIVAAKLVPLLAIAAGLAALIRRFRGIMVPGFAFLAPALLLFCPEILWVRPDPLEFLLAALALAALPRRHAGWWIGLCIGAAVNLKIHAFLYFLPALFELWQLRGWRVLPSVGIAAAVAFLLPFLLPGISLEDYLTSLAEVGRRAPVWGMLPLALFTTTLLVFPLILAMIAAPSGRAYAGAVLITVLILFYPMLFPGAGSYHLVPLLPALALAYHRLRPSGSTVGGALFPLVAGAVCIGTLDFLTLGMMRDWGTIAQQAVQLERRAPDRPVGIGYGETLRSYLIGQSARVSLTLDGQSQWLDAQILMELRRTGMTKPDAGLVAELERCRTALWLVPRGEQPFALPSFYYGGEPVFSPEFRAAFLAHDRLVGSEGEFDLWRCSR